MTTISISTPLKEELKELGSKSDTYEDIIKRNINFVKKFTYEDNFHSWFELNFQLFGFEKLIESNRNSFPDLVLFKDGKEVRVELETLSSNFVRHHHDPSKVDLVICLMKDKELSVPTVEITPFIYNKKPIFYITVSDKTYEDFSTIYHYLKSSDNDNGNSKRTTYETIMRMLIDNKKELLEEAKKFKIEYDNLRKNIKSESI